MLWRQSAMGIQKRGRFQRRPPLGGLWAESKQFGVRYITWWVKERRLLPSEGAARTYLEHPAQAGCACPLKSIFHTAARATFWNIRSCYSSPQTLLVAPQIFPIKSQGYYCGLPGPLKSNLMLAASLIWPTATNCTSATLAPLLFLERATLTPQSSYTPSSCCLEHSS